MTVKDLIKKLSEFPPNMQVMLWDGWEGEYDTRIKVKKSRAERVVYKDENRTKTFEWVDYNRFGGNIQSKNIIVIEAKKPKGTRLLGR